MSNLKQALVLREDIGMSKGKMIAQAAHASVKAYEKASESTINDWQRQGGKKVVLSSGDQTLDELCREAKRNKLPVYLVKDAGRTELEPGTKTALAIGPAEEDKINTVTGSLKLIE